MTKKYIGVGGVSRYAHTVRKTFKKGWRRANAAGGGAQGRRAAAMSGNAPSCTRMDPEIGGRRSFFEKKNVDPVKRQSGKC